jgi:hypothetical protein
MSYVIEQQSRIRRRFHGDIPNNWPKVHDLEGVTRRNQMTARFK